MIVGWAAATWGEQVATGGGIGHAGGGDQRREQQSEGVGDDAALAADDLFACVGALGGGGDVGRGLDALGVDHAGGRFRVATLSAAD